ncbi:MAG: succinate dehydrogenase cytochrome b subunit [Paludibacteraceae bacterium]|nr:succinate dehydrogenase cytochrome b subunit [Paludibacteraceae bacterium]
MWLKDSSIGRKFVMSLTGLALVFFLLFHGCMNLTVIFSEDAYNTICHLLGANWYALIGTLGLAFLVLVHFCYAIYLTLQNRAARGNDRYAVTGKKEGVEWESENMLVLGGVVIGFLVLHLYNFWFKMQFSEIIGSNMGAFDPQDGAAYVRELFTAPTCGTIYCLLYLVWLCALWLHLNHGVWSAMHTLGWNNLVWQKRIKVIGSVVATLAVLPFALVVLYYLGLNIGLIW